MYLVHPFLHIFAETIHYALDVFLNCFLGPIRKHPLVACTSSEYFICKNILLVWFTYVLVPSSKFVVMMSFLPNTFYRIIARILHTHLVQINVMSWRNVSNLSPFAFFPGTLMLISTLFVSEGAVSALPIASIPKLSCVTSLISASAK